MLRVHLLVQAADEDNDKEVIYELRQQVESIWHEYVPI